MLNAVHATFKSSWERKKYIHISISLFVNLACIAVGVEMVGLMACQCK